MRNCCIRGCLSTSRNERLYNFPNNQRLLDLWISRVILFAPGLSGKSPAQCIFKKVCAKHFEKKYIKADGSRLYYSCPTLFSPQEIASGIPRAPVTFLGSSEDHSYSVNVFNVFNEHNYVRKPLVAEDSGESSAKKYKARIELEEPVCSHWYMKDVEEMNISRHELEESLVQKYSRLERGSLSEQNSPNDQDSPDEQYEIDTEVPVEIQCNHIFSWPKSYQTKSLLDSPGHELEESLVQKYSRPERGSLSEHNSPNDQDRPDEQYEIDTEVPVEIQCNHIFSWLKSYQTKSLLDSPVEVLELEVSDADKKVQASVTEDNQCVPQGGDQLQCCECRRAIPEHSVRCVCVSCTDGDICSVCAVDDKHSYHYALRVPAIATQSEVREVLQKIRRVLLEESLIKEEIKEEDNDPLSSATHIVRDTSYEDCISQVPNINMQDCYKLPKSTRKMSRMEEILKSSDEDPSEVFEGNSPRKRRRSKTQYQTDIPTAISKEEELSVVLHPLENMLKWALSPKEPKQNQDSKTFTHLNQKNHTVQKINIGLMKSVRKTNNYTENRASERETAYYFRHTTGNETSNDFGCSPEKAVLQIKDLNIKKIEDLQPTRITLKRPAQTAPAREEPSTSNETMNILPTKKIII